MPIVSKRFDIEDAENNLLPVDANNLLNSVLTNVKLPIDLQTLPSLTGGLPSVNSLLRTNTSALSSSPILTGGASNVTPNLTQNTSLTQLASQVGLSSLDPSSLTSSAYSGLPPTSQTNAQLTQNLCRAPNVDSDRISQALYANTPTPYPSTPSYSPRQSPALQTNSLITQAASSLNDLAPTLGINAVDTRTLSLLANVLIQGSYNTGNVGTTTMYLNSCQRPNQLYSDIGTQTYRTNGTNLYATCELAGSQYPQTLQPTIAPYHTQTLSNYRIPSSGFKNPRNTLYLVQVVMEALGVDLRQYTSVLSPDLQRLISVAGGLF